MKRLILVVALLATFACSNESTPPPSPTPAPTAVPTVVAMCDPCTAQCPDWKAVGVGPNGPVYQNTQTGEQRTCSK